MRLTTKLVLATTVFTTVVTIALCSVFFSELLRGRFAQAQDANEVLSQEVVLSMRAALQSGLAANDPKEPGEFAFERAVKTTLQQDPALEQTMNAIVSYSPTVQDVYISGANGRVLVSTDPTLLDVSPPRRRSFGKLATNGFREQLRIVFGQPEVFDNALPLQRNGGPFLYAHIGVRSTLLRNVLKPWLQGAALIGAVALLCSLAASLILSSVALRPIAQISQRLDALSALSGAGTAAVEPASRDAMQRVSSTISRIDQQIRTSEQHQTELATNLSQMLQTLKDGVMLLTADGRVAMASDSVRNFLQPRPGPIVGERIETIFPVTMEVGALLSYALRTRRVLQNQLVPFADGREVEVSLDFPAASGGMSSDGLDAMLTLHDAAAQERVEREIDLSRRLASIGRLTAGVGHEVKNPINAMVLHLELLRNKLKSNDGTGAVRHVDVLASEMTRLDRVVQTLADFTRPLEPDLHEQPLRAVVDSVLRLISVDAGHRAVRISVRDDAAGAQALIDSELLRQALLNIVLNGMDAMPNGGSLQVRLFRERGSVGVAIRDTGTGIAPETLDRIFHLYFTTKPTGSGIGLAMTWRIVQILGGTIAVQSTTDAASSDHGTLFTVRLPLATRSHGAAGPQVVHA